MSNNKNENSDSIIITKESAKRLLSDVKDIMKDPLHNEGIYYKHDEENMLKGYALIIGPKESLYFGGNFLFEIIYPNDYPHRPPIVKYKTNDGLTRFHPNLYKNGKVCLSILNTWKGEQWTGCQTIRSVLLTILSILDKNPLLHEPGVSITHRDFENYNKIIRYKSIEVAFLNVISDDCSCCPLYLKNLFKEDIQENYEKNKKEIFDIIKSNKETVNIKTSLYIMNINIDWKNLKSQIKNIK
jgi:ubiquitin-protein ligase